MSDYKEPEIVLNFMKDAAATKEDALYEKAEMDLLRAALKRTHEERFLVMTSLMKMNIMFRNAKVTYTQYTLNK
jgi:hypothetical protein